MLKRRFAVYTIDPGGTTGCGYGEFRPRSTIKKTFAAGDWDTWEVPGEYYEQALVIFRDLVRRRQRWLKRGGSFRDFHVVIESFQLLVHKARGAGSDPAMLAPVRVTSALIALAHAFEGEGGERWLFDYQTPGEKASITPDRLRRMGLWVVGSEHRRDAVRHMVVRVDRLID